MLKLLCIQHSLFSQQLPIYRNVLRSHKLKPLQQRAFNVLKRGPRSRFRELTDDSLYVCLIFSQSVQMVLTVVFASPAQCRYAVLSSSFSSSADSSSDSAMLLSSSRTLSYAARHTSSVTVGRCLCTGSMMLALMNGSSYSGNHYHTKLNDPKLRVFS